MPVSDWTEGYVADVDYTFGYYSELNPLRMALPFLNVGLLPPGVATACELGFGQGLSINIHAAASKVRWYGTDFNPAHTAFAQSLADAAGSGVQLYDQSFAEFCGRGDLPDFDYIALHGIWSWISPDNQRVIVDFVRRKLKVGGVLYISYNCQPGHAATVPLRHLLTEHAEVMAAPGRGRLARIDAALDFAERLLALKPLFAGAFPTVGEQLQAMKGHNRRYLAHEYFNEDWQAPHFADIADALAPAKLGFACSAQYLDHIDGINLTVDQQRFLAEIPDPVFRQSLRDFVVNMGFRRDYWVRGARRLSVLEQGEAIRRLPVMLVGPRGDMAVSVRGALGELQMNSDIARAVLDALGDRQPQTIGDIERSLRGAGIGLPAIFETLMLLASRDHVAAVQQEEIQEQARPQTERLNRGILERARSRDEIATLASPATGGGVPAPRFHQLFLLARRDGRREPDELGQFAWDLLAAQNQRLLKDGKPLDSADENLAELRAQARDFVDNRLSVLESLQIA